MPANNTEIEKRLWDAADDLRANSKLKSSEYSVPVLGLILLRFADFKYAQAEKELQGPATGRRQTSKVDYQALGAMYIPPEARWAKLLELPESANIGKAINDAMRRIEEENDDLRDVLPKTYNRLDNRVLISLLKNFNAIPMDIEGDAFGKIYEYFLGKFAMSEGQKGGEFFTPTSLVKLIVEVIEPYHGRIYDPACGSGGMFVQSAGFVKRRRHDPGREISIFGQEKVAETVRLCKINLAVHGLAGDIRQGNSYYEDLHSATGKFDFVMANPPFNVDKVDKERLKDDAARFPLGMPRADNANYLWMQLFYSALNETGRAGFVMANSASDARQSEGDIRRQMIQAGVLDVMIAIGNNFFYTVTLPCTLWFLDKGKRSTARKDTVLFLDARNIFTQLDRAHREFTPEQVALIADLVRLYRGEPVETLYGNGSPVETLHATSLRDVAPNLTDAQIEILQNAFQNQQYLDVPGLCKIATLTEIEAQGWSLNPGRYVGVAERDADEFVFEERLEELNEELALLNTESHRLEEQITENMARIIASV